MIRSLIFSLLIGLVGAALLHVIIVLALPSWSGRDAFTKVENLGESSIFFPIANERNASGLANDDPHIRSAVCRYDLTDAPIRILADGRVPLWTVAIFNSSSDEIFSMNDRSAIGDGLDLIVATPVEMLQLKRNLSNELDQSVLVESDDADGFVVLRAIVPEQSDEPAARSFLTGASCQQIVFG